MKQYPMYIPPSQVGKAIRTNDLLCHLLSLGGEMYPEQKRGITFVDVNRRNVEAAKHRLAEHVSQYIHEYGADTAAEAETILQVIARDLEKTGVDLLTYVC